MKNLAKQALFFSLSFIIIFLAATGVRFLSLWVDLARQLPQKPETVLTLLVTAASWALSLTLYSSILLALSYAARRKYFAPATVVCLMVLSLCFQYGASIALDHWKAVPPAQSNVRPLGKDGLILSNSLSRSGAAVVLLKGAADPLGPRVTVIPGRPMSFQASTTSESLDLPPIPFGDDTPWFLKSLAIDFRLCGEQLQGRFNEGSHSYFIYAGALIFLLCSLGFIVKLSVWPLASLFIGILSFRGILAIETFFNSPEMQEIFDSFFEKMLPSSLAVPLIFFGFGVLVHLYSILVFISRRRGKDE